MTLEPLPIDSHLPAILSALTQNASLVITAPPGTGKTTRIPRALYDSDYAAHGEILILQPRRLATRLAAARVASELGEAVGQSVGYAMRFDAKGGPSTRIKFVTEGVLSRRIVQDPHLRGVSVVILDEFHERHVATDLALAFLRLLQQQNRPDLKLLVMSATMNPAPVAAFLGHVPVITGEGSQFPVSIEFEARTDKRPLAEKVHWAVARLLREGLSGDVLVFLPGAAEIRLAMDALRPLSNRENLALIPLHGDLPPAQQGLAVEPCVRRKVILATNVAETSITIPGIAAVVDSGLARVAVHSAWTGIPLLKLTGISKAAAAQRAGRAGRTRDGRVLRLYSRVEYDSRAESDLPEVMRSDLAETMLTLHGAGFTDPRNFPWFETPPAAALDAAEILLQSLEALDRKGQLTGIGRQMLRLPVHPRLARLITEGEKQNVLDEAVRMAALLSERDIRLQSRGSIHSTSKQRRTARLGSSDPIELLECLEEAEGAGHDARQLLAEGLDPGSVDRVRRAHRQLLRLVAGHKRRETDVDVAECLRIAVLTAFPDRVAKRRMPGSRDLLLAVGGTARLSEESGVHEAPLLVAVDVEERRGEGGRRATEPLVRLASAIEPEWLAALFPDRLEQHLEIRWNERASRVDETRRTYYGQVVLEETVQPAALSKETSAILADAIISRGLACLSDHAAIGDLRVRLALLIQHFPSEKFPALDPPFLQNALLSICANKRSIAELDRISLVDACLKTLTHRQKELLLRQVPERLAIGPKRVLTIHYEEGRTPWIESRLQDFFHVKSTPAICNGRIPLTVRLLAPNGRPVQITQDLSGFWLRHYPTVRRELQRRYPKHAWPRPEEISG